MALWKPLRGGRASLNSTEKHDGYVYFCVDDGSLFFDYTDADGVLQRRQINAKEAETLAGVSLDELRNEIATQDVVVLQASQDYTDTALESKANSYDEALETTDKTLTGAINEINRKVGSGGIGASADIPIFDLAALGLGNVAPDDIEVSVETDTTEIVAALSKGTVKFILNVGSGDDVGQLSIMPTICSIHGAMYLCTAAIDFNGKMLASIIVLDGTIAVCISPFESAEGESTPAIPTFDLAALGLSAVALGGSETVLQTDTSEIISALEKGTVKFLVNVAMGEVVAPFSVVPNIACSSAEGAYMCTAVYELNGSKWLVTLAVQNGVVAVWALAFEEAAASSNEIPFFDLTALGCTNIPFDGSMVTVNVGEDVKNEIITAARSGPVKFGLTGSGGDSNSVITNFAVLEGMMIGSADLSIRGALKGKLTVLAEIFEGDHTIAVSVLVEQDVTLTGIDFSNYESNGQIVETYSDGSTKITTVEFDSNGNPSKITDSNGNEVAFTW